MTGDQTPGPRAGSGTPLDLGLGTRHVVVMGVSGSGKTTVAHGIAAATGLLFAEADDFHSRANVDKMSAGTPLDDADRWPWLDELNRLLRGERDAVLACSALKDSYRKRLLAGVGEWRLFFLSGDKALIGSRLAARKHRYMPASLLDSQFAALEPPAQAIRIDVAAPIERSVDAIVQALER